MKTVSRFKALGVLTTCVALFAARAALASSTEDALAAQVSAMDKFAAEQNADTAVGDVILDSGHRRVMETVRVSATPELLEKWRQAGQAVAIDPQTGEALIERFHDLLPRNWVNIAPPGVKIDSYGNPIVNETPGLPAWAQRDIDALRHAIASWRDTFRTDAANRTENAGILGNFIGQAIVRGVAYADLVDLKDPVIVTPQVASAIIGYLHYYESVRFVHAADGSYAYSPTIYEPAIAAFVESHGAKLEDVQALADIGGEEGGIAGGVNCYARGTFARGMSNLVTHTDIWVQNGLDDDSSDVPIGFPVFNYQACEDRDNNNQVRVSTNGFVSFFQQGGGALNGVEYVNTAIPDVADPDGFIAGWWDDLLIELNQGTADRVSYETSGAVGQRVFTVEWFSVSRRLGNSTDFHFFQIKLYEITGVIELHYGLDGSGWSPDTSDNASTGIENYAGTGGACGPNCDPTNSTPPPNNYRFTPISRPGNDTCGAATRVGPGDDFIDDLLIATNDGSSACESVNRDVWYRFTAVCAGQLTVTTCGTNDRLGLNTGMDTVVSLHSACPGTTANDLTCNDDASGECGPLDVSLLRDSRVARAMVAGQSVLIRVTHLSGTIGDGRFRLQVDYAPLIAQRPANDDCANAAAVADGAVFSSSLACATNDGTSSCGNSRQTPDVWYKFTPPCDGTLRVTTCGTDDLGGTDAGMDTVVSIHSGCPGGIQNQVACSDDDGCPGQNGLFHDSTAIASVTAGATYLIRVTYYSPSVSTGTFNMQVNYTPAPPPNNACGSAIVVQNGDVLTGDISCATNDGAAGCGTSASNPDVWFKFTAPTAGRLLVRTCGTHDRLGSDTGMDTVLSIHTSCPGTVGNQLICNDDYLEFGNLCGAFDQAVARDSSVAATLANGQMVLIRLSHFSSTIADGAYVLRVSFGSGVAGDMNCDGVLNNFDIEPFVLAVVDPDAYHAAFPNCDILNGDISGNGVFNNFDIDPFVTLLIGG